MIKDINNLLQNIYKKIVPEAVQNKITPALVKIWMRLSTIATHRRKRKLHYLEVRITEHCNLNCACCLQFSPIADEGYISIETFTKDFERLSLLTAGQINLIRLMGGEPLLHPALIDLMRITRKYFTKSRIVLVTNGVLLLKQKSEFWENCKEFRIEIHISHYPINIKFSALQKIADTHGVYLKYATEKPQSMYKWSFDTSGGQDAKKTFARCYFGSNCIQVDNGKLYNCPLIPCIKHFNKQFNKELIVSQTDSIDIYKVSNIEQVLDFLYKPVPFCKYCNLDKLEIGIKWGVSSKVISEWV